MGYIFAFFIIIVFVPFTLLLVWIIRRSTRKLNPKELENERYKLDSYVNRILPSLVRLNNPDEISGNIQGDYSKGFAIKSSGIILSLSGQPILAYSAIHRGIYTNERIVLKSNTLSYYIEVFKTDKKIDLNGTTLGYTDSSRRILDPNRKPIGQINIKKMCYEIVLNGRVAASINFSEAGFSRTIGIGTELAANRIAAHNIVDTFGEYLTEEEKHWVICLTAYEMIHIKLQPAPPTMHRRSTHN